MKLVLKLLVGILNLIFTFFKLLPVQNKVTFISRQANEKTEDVDMLGKELEKQGSGLEVVYLCRKLEGNLLQKLGYCFHMLSQMYHIATSKVVILDSYCICISVLKQRESLVVIQMWHALGSLKKFGLSIVGDGEGSSKEIADAMSMHKGYTYVLTSSEACLPNFAEAFGYSNDLSKMKVMSLPRVDKLTDEKLKEETLNRIYQRYPEFKEKKVIVYAPTFRKNLDISVEIDNLARQFNEDEYVFVLKKHPHMNVDCKFGLVDQEFTTLEMLYAADYVVCDYSAVIYEAAILKKPLFFYTFDYDSYGVDRDFYIDYKAEMPGVMEANPEHLASAIKRGEYDLARVEAFAYKSVAKQTGCTRELGQFILDSIERGKHASR